MVRVNPPSLRANACQLKIFITIQLSVPYKRMAGQLLTIHFPCKLVASVYLPTWVRLINAEKGTKKIVVEVKSFVGRSDVRDLEQALGQYILYRQVLNEMGIDRRLYLAISQPAFKSGFTI